MKPYYEHAGITIYHGNCLEVLPGLDPVNSVVTDPPYEIRDKWGTSVLYGRRMQFSFDVVGVTEDVVIPALEIAFGLADSFHTFCECEQYALIARAARSAGHTPKPYAKIKKCPPPPMPGNWWTSGFELAMYGYKPGAYFGDSSAIRPNVYRGDSYRHGIRSSEKTAHPTQKWLPMIAYLVETLLPQGACVLDPFMGSGTTLRAAKDLGRCAIGIEIEEKYCEIAANRLSQETLFGIGQVSQIDSTG